MSLHTTASAKPPFADLYDFVKMHLVIVNCIVLASGTIVGALDFLAPRLSFIPAVVYSLTALLALSMLAVALAPRLIARTPGAIS